MKKNNLTINLITKSALSSTIDANTPFINKKDNVLEIILSNDSSVNRFRLKEYIFNDKQSSQAQKTSVLNFLVTVNDKNINPEESLFEDYIGNIINNSHETYKYLKKPEAKWIIDWIFSDLNSEKLNSNLFQILKLMSFKEIKNIKLTCKQKEDLLFQITDKKINDFNKILFKKLNFSIPFMINKINRPLDNSILNFFVEEIEKFPLIDVIETNEKMLEPKIKNNYNNFYEPETPRKHIGEIYSIETKEYDMENVIISILSFKYSYTLENINTTRPDLLKTIGFDKILNSVLTIDHNNSCAKNLACLLKIFPEQKLSDDTLKLFSLNSINRNKEKTSRVYENLMLYYYQSGKLEEAKKCFEIIGKNSLFKKNESIQSIEQWIELNKFKITNNKKSVAIL